MRAQLEVSREREAGVSREQTQTAVLRKEVTFLEAQLNQALSSIGRDVEEVRSLLAIEKHACAAAEGRAAAAELEVIHLRTRLKSADENMAAQAREHGAASQAAREAHAVAIHEVREGGVRERERHAEVIEHMRMELAQTREAAAQSLTRAEDTRIRLVREEAARGAAILKETVESEASLRKALAEVEAAHTASVAEVNRLNDRLATSEEGPGGGACGKHCQVV